MADFRPLVGYKRSMVEIIHELSPGMESNVQWFKGSMVQGSKVQR